MDFGLWQRLSPADLIMPIDLHVERQARPLGLLTRKLVDWEAAEELTANLRKMDPSDPVKYDFALFGAGVDKYSVARRRRGPAGGFEYYLQN
ncbi:uncharacterized protein (TIGR02757 family) [Hymenobacter sp. 1B]|uniref:Uncharacterized protein (TIGR02757 family) n=1 Tax=Hymenobacter artigasi TaxID=2719616 RepID=A0ABX1HIV3_9BACT|nr:uncharacterized protein (TIGR02757 family) [Hymenobacter artigasi]